MGAGLELMTRLAIVETGVVVGSEMRVASTPKHLEKFEQQYYTMKEQLLVPRMRVPKSIMPRNTCVMPIIIVNSSLSGCDNDGAAPWHDENIVATCFHVATLGNFDEAKVFCNFRRASSSSLGRDVFELLPSDETHVGARLVKILFVVPNYRRQSHYLGPNELPNLVSSYRPDNHNYLQWAQDICTTLKGRKKLSYIEGNCPPRDDPKFEAWDDEDSLIMTWLWYSMTPEISRNYMFYFSIREIWENLIKTYSIKKDSVPCYDIESKIFNSRQGTLSVS
ncbi:hypothetical protein CR513_43935, partial [Mucuna pruriens]